MRSSPSSCRLPSPSSACRAGFLVLLCLLAPSPATCLAILSPSRLDAGLAQPDTSPPSSSSILARLMEDNASSSPNNDYVAPASSSSAGTTYSSASTTTTTSNGVSTQYLVIPAAIFIFILLLALAYRLCSRVKGTRWVSRAHITTSKPIEIVYSDVEHDDLIVRVDQVPGRRSGVREPSRDLRRQPTYESLATVIFDEPPHYETETIPQRPSGDSPRPV
ncbi:hypothetical protein HKX48_007041 [Thoreauomyces humboldtii]|nr:hypothetical protein HKX48_007041 [Thoreauomyces humboldtii]